MTATFWSNFSKPNNSTKQPTATGTAYTVYLKDNVSVLAPVFRIDGIDLTVTYCQWNNRYYFVRDIVLSNNNIYEVHCEIDVMATWKSAIGSSSQYVLRSASQSDGNVVDLFYPSKKDPTVIKTDASYSHAGWAGSLTSGWYVVGIIGGSSSDGASQGVVQYYVFTSSEFNSFTQTVFTQANWTDMTDADRYSFNPIQYIASVKWFPMEPPMQISSISSVKMGWESIACSCHRLSLGTNLEANTFTVSKHPQAASRGNYLNSAPFSEYFVHFSPYGDFALDPDVMAEITTLNASHKIDFITGRGTLILWASLSGTNTYEFARRDVQLGVTIQISQIAADRIGAASGVVGTVGGVIGNLLSGNVIGAITGAFSGIGSAYQSIQPHVASHGSNDSLSGVMGSYVGWTLYHKFYEVVAEDNTTCGRPLCQQKTISTLSGFVMCANTEISIAGLPSERDQIVQYMNSGFFYE